MFKAPLARKMLETALILFKWYRHSGSANKILGLGSHVAEREKKVAESKEADALEVIDGDGEGSEEEGLMDQDQDTETEMPGEGYADDGNDVDSMDDEDHGPGHEVTVTGSINY